MRLDVGEGHTLGQHGAELGLDLREVGALEPTLEGDRAQHVVGAALEEFAGEGRREELDLAAAGAVLVLEQGVDVDGADADQLHPDLLAPRHLEVERVVTLGVADPADRHRLAQVIPEEACRPRVHHELVGLVGVGQPALGHHDPVLVEAQSVHAAVGADALGGGQRLAVLLDRPRVDAHLGLDLLHVGQVGDRAEERRVVAVEPGGRVVEAVEDEEIRGVGAGGEVERATTRWSGPPRWHPWRARRATRSGGPRRAGRPSGARRWLGSGTRRTRAPGFFTAGRSSRVAPSAWPRQPRSWSAVRAAPSPHMPWTPPPGGVEAEHRYTPLIPVR